MSERVEIKRRVEIGKERIIFLIDNVSGLKLSFFFNNLRPFRKERADLDANFKSHVTNLI